MPLARILTLHPEDAATLMQQLERFGFRVETASPNQEDLAPADLEIEFAVCDLQHVIGRAAAIAAQLQAEVVVFPGAVPPVPRAVAPAPEVAECIAELESNQTREPLEAPPVETAAPVEEQPGSELPAAEHASPAWSGNFGYSEEPAVSRLAALQGRLASALSTMVTRIQEYRERRQTRAQEAAVAREELLAEKERHRAEAAQYAALMEEEGRKQAEIAMAARQEELQHEQAEREKRLEEMERLRAESREQIAALEQARQLTETQQRQAKQTVQPGLERRPVRRPLPRPSQAKGIFTGAIAASLLFFVGMVLANFHPRTPFPASVSNGSVEQQVPFGATTVRGTPGVTIGGPNQAPPIRASNTTPRQPAPVQAKPQPAGNNPHSSKPTPQWRRFRRSSNNDESDVTADDVVVRHYPQARKPQPQHVQQAGMKRYSDLDQ